MLLLILYLIKKGVIVIIHRSPMCIYFNSLSFSEKKCTEFTCIKILASRTQTTCNTNIFQNANQFNLASYA